MLCGSLVLLPFLWLVHGLPVNASHILMLTSFGSTSTLNQAIVETCTSTRVHFVIVRFAKIHARLHAYKLHCVSLERCFEGLVEAL